METLKSKDPYDRSVRIYEWKTDDAVSNSRSVVSRLSAECLKTFEVLVKGSAKNSSLSKINLANLNRSRESLILWVNGYCVLEGNLDEKLEKSWTLQRTTLQLLASVGNTLTKRLAPQLNLNNDADDVVELERVVAEAKSTLQLGDDDSCDEESDSDSSSISESSEILEIIEDLKTDMQCLMDLESLLQAPTFSPRTKLRKPEQPWRSWSPHQLYCDRICHRFSKAKYDLVERFARANWDRFQRTQSERVYHASQQKETDDPEICAAGPIAAPTEGGTKFHDSGVGTSLHASSTYAETVMTYRQSEGHSVRIPSLPAEARKGAFFECMACGRHIQAMNNSAWKKHLYMDLRPWVCHEAACEYGNDSFHSRDDWIQHLALQHGFDNGWQSIECPFCLEPTGSGKVVIVKHLSSHMEEISLASLPAGVDSDSDDESSSIASEHSESAEANQNHPALGPKVINRIHELILRPLLAKPALKDFEPILLDVPRQIQSKEIICLRDLEKTLILMAPERTKTAALYIDFCLASVRFIQATVEYLSDREKTRPGDRPYTNGYFIDLKDNILEYGRQLAAANVSPEDMGIDASGETKLFGGIAVNGRPAELVRVLKDGTHISMDTGKVVDVDEAPIKIKRSLSEQREGEQEIIKSMARRKKISPEELAPKKCKEPGCDKAFKRRCDLTKHEKTHSRPWKCPLPACKYHHYGWPNKKEMDRHFNAKHVEPPALYECLYKPCLYKFKRESNCKQHMEKAHGWTYVRTKKNGMAPNAASEQGHFTTHQVLGGYSAIYGDTDSVQPQLPTTDQPSATAKANPESN